MNIEINSHIYQVKNKTGYKLFLLMQDHLKGWSLTGFGWESDLYKEIGKRSADIENGYLQSNNIVKQTMESYVEHYENLISNPSTYGSLLDDFHVTIQIDMNTIPEYSKNRTIELINGFLFTEKEDNIFELSMPSQELMLTYGIQEEFIRIVPKVKEMVAAEEYKEEILYTHSKNIKQLQLF
ncbi:MAG: hypothetical protein ABS939_00740 [Psychrobacillus sp.]